MDKFEQATCIECKSATAPPAHVLVVEHNHDGLWNESDPKTGPYLCAECAGKMAHVEKFHKYIKLMEGFEYNFKYSRAVTDAPPAPAEQHGHAHQHNKEHAHAHSAEALAEKFGTHHNRDHHHHHKSDEHAGKGEHAHAPPNHKAHHDDQHHEQHHKKH